MSSFDLKAAMYGVIMGLVVTVSSCTNAQIGNEIEKNCLIGAYSYGDQKVVLYDRIRKGEEPSIGYVFVDGRRGVLGRPNALLNCFAGTLKDDDGNDFQRIELTEIDTSFQSDATNLAGRLITPSYEEGDLRPLVVFVHGSESTPTVGRSSYPYLLAAQGLTVFVYDKRGTGSSEGEYTQNFELLGKDAEAAFNHAVDIAEGQYDRAGYFGGSQGGWVAPLAASRTDVDFIIVGFGLVLSPAEEDAEQVYDEMRRAGYGASDINKAREVTAATGTIIASGFTEGIDALLTVKQRYQDEPWLSEIEGEFTGSVLNASEEDLRAGVAGDFQDSNVIWRYDAMGVLRLLNVPQLWVIAENDTAAPGNLTRERLAMLQAEGLPITTAVFPNTDHGMIEFTEDSNGVRTYTQFTEGYFRLIADTAKLELAAPYGRAEITPIID